MASSDVKNLTYVQVQSDAVLESQRATTRCEKFNQFQVCSNTASVRRSTMHPMGILHVFVGSISSKTHTHECLSHVKFVTGTKC
jgi:hypothetical protein